jgi:hypothetical protein
LNICVKKLYSQMILLLFVLCQLVAMQGKWWMKAICCYVSMTTVYMISAKLEQSTCKVDLLGCVDHLQEAENMIKVMRCEPDVTCYCIQAHQHSSWYSTLIYVSFQGLPHFHEVHFQDSGESNHGEGCQSLLLLRGWCLFMYGLLVMPVAVCLDNDYIKFILFVACLVVLLYHHSWTLLSDVLPMRRSHCGAPSP